MKEIFKICIQEYTTYWKAYLILLVSFIMGIVCLSAMPGWVGAISAFILLTIGAPSFAGFKKEKDNAKLAIIKSIEDLKSNWMYYGSNFILGVISVVLIQAVSSAILGLLILFTYMILQTVIAVLIRRYKARG